MMVHKLEGELLEIIEKDPEKGVLKGQVGRMREGQQRCSEYNRGC